MPVQTSLTGVNTDIAECMNNACAASTAPYQVMRIDFLRWIPLIIRCSLDVVVGAEPEHAGCVWHRTFCAQLYNADKKEIRIPLPTVNIHHSDQERFCLSWGFTMIVDCIDFLSLIYSYVAKRTTPHGCWRTNFCCLPAMEFRIVMQCQKKIKHSWHLQWKAGAPRISHGVGSYFWSKSKRKCSYWFNKRLYSKHPFPDSFSSTALHTEMCRL